MIQQKYRTFLPLNQHGLRYSLQNYITLEYQHSGGIMQAKILVLRVLKALAWIIQKMHILLEEDDSQGPLARFFFVVNSFTIISSRRRFWILLIDAWHSSKDIRIRIWKSRKNNWCYEWHNPSVCIRKDYCFVNTCLYVSSLIYSTGICVCIYVCMFETYLLRNGWTNLKNSFFVSSVLVRGRF